MKTSRTLRAVAAVALATGTLSAGLAAPAQAAAWEGFVACGSMCSVSSAAGTVDWHNRTATVSGGVFHLDAGFTTAYFEAYDGDIKIDSTTRTSHNGNRDFSFTIGDTNRVGGFNRLKVQVCRTENGSRVCDPAVHVYK
jgi:hypothetical protein